MVWFVMFRLLDLEIIPFVFLYKVQFSADSAFFLAFSMIFTLSYLEIYALKHNKPYHFLIVLFQGYPLKGLKFLKNVKEKC